jgi:uroporphyrin-III C-methyltransferase
MSLETIDAHRLRIASRHTQTTGFLKRSPARQKNQSSPSCQSGKGCENPTMNTKHIGTVHLVGAGPGDPELLTLRAARLLRDCAVVVYDHLVGQGVLELIGSNVRRIYVGKKSGRHTMPQNDINTLLVDLARQGLNVVRLKGGDPYIFGRGGEEVEQLVACGIPCEVVPGITAASGMSAYAGIPLTHRDFAQTCLFVTGHLQNDSVDLDWPTLARPHQTVVVYMGLATLDEICRQLIAHGRAASTPAAVVRHATLPDQRVLTGTLSSLPQAVQTAKLSSPALIVVGEVVTLHERLQPAQQRKAKEENQ